MIYVILIKKNGVTLHNISWVEIEGRVNIFMLYISIDVRVFLQVTRRKPKTFAKIIQKIGPTCKGGKVVTSSKNCICQHKLYCIVNI